MSVYGGINILSGLKFFDLHCDTLTECHKRGIALDNKDMHWSLRKIPDNIHLCQCMAIFMPDNLRGKDARAYFDEIYEYWQNQKQLYKDVFVETSPKLASETLEKTKAVGILTVEGGSVLAGKIDAVSELYDKGVRMMTITWNDSNELAGGVLSDKGFSKIGRAVIKEMERVGMIVDVSHLNDRSFWELCDFADKPFVASHSNSRRICRHRRNLTDEMFYELIRRNGICGINFYDDFLTFGGGSKKIDDLLRHVHHFLDIGGDKVLALGSDFDGAYIPEYLDGVDKLEFLAESLSQSGIPTNTVEDILFNNAQNFFKRTNI
jgi:membrane dipeptidase